jgi:hypothetical protein
VRRHDGVGDTDLAMEPRWVPLGACPRLHAVESGMSVLGYLVCVHGEPIEIGVDVIQTVARAALSCPRRG